MSEDQATNNAAVSERDSAPDRGNERGDRPSRGDSSELSGGRRDRSRELLREELSRNLDDATRRSGRPRDWEPADRPARAAREATAEPGSAGASVSDAGGTSAGGAAQIDTSTAPKSWRADERAHYDQLPPEIKNAVHRREVEMERGVAELKNNYAELDSALAPHLPVIKKFGHTPGAAVRQLFSWFTYLHQDPLRAFPDLVRSMGAEKIFQQQLQQQQQQPQAQLDPFQQYAQSVEQRLNGFQQTIQQQQEAAQLDRCNAVIAEFGKTHPHLDRVRVAMAAFLQPDQYGRSIVPLTPSGEINLQAAYDMACRADATIGEQMITERISAKTKAQREQAERARYSSSSLRPASPGSGSSTAPKKRVGGKSVRDSINEAMLEIRDA